MTNKNYSTPLVRLIFDLHPRLISVVEKLLKLDLLGDRYHSLGNAAQPFGRRRCERYELHVSEQLVLLLEKLIAFFGLCNVLLLDIG